MKNTQSKLQKGYVLPSGKFVLQTRIKSLDSLYNQIKRRPSLFVRHRMLSASFLYSMRFNTLVNYIECGYVWTAKRIKK